MPSLLGTVYHHSLLFHVHTSMPRLDYMEEGRLQVLRLPPARRLAPAPTFGMLPLSADGWTPLYQSASSYSAATASSTLSVTPQTSGGGADDGSTRTGRELHHERELHASCHPELHHPRPQGRVYFPFDALLGWGQVSTGLTSAGGGCDGLCFVGLYEVSHGLLVWYGYWILTLSKEPPLF